MNSLSALMRVPRTDVIPGHILSKPGYKQLAQAEEHFTRVFMDNVVAGCNLLSPKERVEVMCKAVDDIKLGELFYGGEVFELYCVAKCMLPRLTLWSLQTKHPQVTLDHVFEWYETLDPDVIAEATLRLWGMWSEPSKKNAAAASLSPSTGTPSIGDASPPLQTDSDSPPASLET